MRLLPMSDLMQKHYESWWAGGRRNIKKHYKNIRKLIGGRVEKYHRHIIRVGGRSGGETL